MPQRLLQAIGVLTLIALASPVMIFTMASHRAVLTAPQPSILLRDRDARFLGELGDSRNGDFGYWPVPERNLPERVVAATVAIEDRRFHAHPGVDPIAIARALYQNVTEGERISGASTLAMQIARMQSPGKRTYPRKAAEALAAIAITQRYGRRKVLAHYLRIAPYGNRIHGISYAARRYLDKPVEDLSWAEVAFLTALPQAPGRMNPYDPTGRERAVQRGQRILAHLRADGLLTDAELELARVQIAALVLPPRERRPVNAMHAVLRLGNILDDADTRRLLLHRPILETTLDLELQEEIAWRTFLSVSAWEDQGAGNAAVMVLDRHRQEVLAYVGSTDYFDDAHAGAIDYAQIERSPGSTLKPFLYASALDRGVISPTTIVDDLRRSAEGIGNADGKFLGPLLPRTALANSRNVPAVELLNRIGLDEGYGLYRELGLHADEVSADHYGLGVAIGAMPITLEELVRAYSTLTSDGRLVQPVFYRGQPRREPRRVLSENSARQVAIFLSDPHARLPSFPRMGPNEYPYPVAVKTGTSQNQRDAWAIAWSADHVVGVWIGHPDYTAMHDMGAFRSAAVLAHHVLDTLYATLPAPGPGAFPPPRDHSSARVCALTGKRATPACERVVLEWLPNGETDPASCDAHVQRAIDTRNGLLATSDTAPAHTEVRTFVDLEARYAAWAASAGLPSPPREASPLRDPDVLHDEVLVGGQVAARIDLVPPSYATGSEDSEAVIQVVSPPPATSILRDPETPPGHATVALEVIVDPPAAQVVWYVDGNPYEVVDHPYKTRWALTPGKHTFQARVPYSNVVSTPVHITVH